MVSYFLRWTLLKFFSSFPDEQSQQKVRHLGRITSVAINTSNEVMRRLLWEFWIYNFSRRILERVSVGSIVNIRNECLFIWIHGKWIVRGTNKSHENRFAVHAICLSRATIHTPWTQKKRHSFLNCVKDKQNGISNTCSKSLSVEKLSSCTCTFFNQEMYMYNVKKSEVDIVHVHFLGNVHVQCQKLKL